MCARGRIALLLACLILIFGIHAAAQVAGSQPPPAGSSTSPANYVNQSGDAVLTQSPASERKPPLEELRKNIREKRDPAVQTSWYRPKKTPAVGKALFATKIQIFPYIGAKFNGGRKWLCIVARVEIPPLSGRGLSNDPSFYITKISFSIDGDEFYFDVPSGDSEVSFWISGTSTVHYMYVDTSAAKMESALRRILGGTEIFVTLWGVHDRLSFKMSKEQLQVFSDVLAFYNAL